MMIDQALADRVDGGNGLLPEVAKKNGRIVPAMRFVRSRLEPLLRHARACPEHLQPIFLYEMWLDPRDKPEDDVESG